MPPPWAGHRSARCLQSTRCSEKGDAFPDPRRHCPRCGAKRGVPCGGRIKPCSGTIPHRKGCSASSGGNGASVGWSR